ncbi:hypothetical protein [Kribbella sp. NPDC055071]
MMRYAVRAVPWLRIALAAGLVVVLMELVRWDPWVLWPLQGTAVGLLAGASAWCFDEQAAAVVDVSPRGLGWRTIARSPAVAVLAGIWVAVVVHSRGALFGHSGVVLIQGLVAMLLGAGWAVWRRSGGDSMPGMACATLAVPLASAWALARPLERHLPVFPYATGGVYGDWSGSLILWACVGAAALSLLTAALADVRWRFPA